MDAEFADPLIHTVRNVGYTIRPPGTPDAGSPWIGWTGSVKSTSKTITVIMNSDMSLTANFK